MMIMVGAKKEKSYLIVVHPSSWTAPDKKAKLSFPHCPSPLVLSDRKLLLGRSLLPSRPVMIVPGS